MGRTSDARERLLDATIDLVWPSSYGAIGVDAICAAAGVGKGSFYHFFESKEELLKAALEHHWASRKPILDAIFSPSKTPLERLRDYFEYAYTRQVQIQKERGRVLGCFHNAIGAECAQIRPDVAAKVQETVGRFVRYIETTLRDAQAEGSIRPGDPLADARAVFALVQGGLLQARLYDDPERLRDLRVTGFALLGVQLADAELPRRPERSKRRDART